MREAIKVAGFLPQLGQYVHVRCGNCGELNGVWAHTEYIAADCNCTLFEGKGRFRTEAHYTPLSPAASRSPNK